MKAYVIEQPGGPEVLQLRDIPAPEAKADEVLIRVKAFGLNRAELYLRAGKMGEITSPRVPGIEAVGEVIQDTSGTFRSGQRVATAMGGMQFDRTGSYAEVVAVKRSNVMSLDGLPLPWEELATLPQAFLTVWGAFKHSLNMQPGQTLLVRGATSSVGLAAVTYAKALGLNVFATTRTEAHLPRLIEAGADEALLDVGQIAPRIREMLPTGVDAALDVVGGATLLDTARAIRPLGAMSVIGLLGGAPLLENFNPMQDLPGSIRLSFFSSHLLGTPALPLDDAPLAWIAHQMLGRHIPSLRAMTMEFDEVPQAHRLMENNQVLGKLVIRL